MLNPTYLQASRHGVFYFRWPLPKQLHPQRKASTLKASLGTREPKQALCLARRLGYAAQTLVEYGLANGMQYDEMRNVLRQHFSDLLAAARRKMDETGPLDALDVSAFETGKVAGIEAVEGRNSLSLVEDDAALVSRFIEKYGLPLKAGTQEYTLFQGELHKAYRDFCDSALSHHHSLGRYDYGGLQGGMIQSPSHRLIMTLGEAVQKYVEDEIRAERWVKRSEDQKRQYLELLQSLLGSNTDIASIGPAEVRRVKEALQRLPRNMNKNPATRGKALEQVLAIEHTDRMSIRTLNTYLQTYRSLFAWAHSDGLTPDNPFDKSIIKENKRRVGKRQGFTPDEVQRIESALLTEDRNLRPKESHKWATLIAIYTGARLSEVCQMTLTDVQLHDGLWCFDFNEVGDGKRLKNESSVRKVPIHSRLIDLGIIKYVEKLRQNSSSRLFPDYTYTSKYGWGKNLSVWFNNAFLIRLHLKSKQHVFHSLRHTMATRLLQADVQEPIVKCVLGHAQKGVTQQHYFDKGYKITQLKEAIEKF